MSGKTSETRCKHCQREIELDLSSGFWTAWGDVTCTVLPHIHEPTPPEGEAAPEQDELYGDVCKFAESSGHVTPSMLQRSFRISYPRAIVLIEQMEREKKIERIEAEKFNSFKWQWAKPAPVVSTAAPEPPSMQEINLPWTVSGDSPANPPMVWDASGDSIVNQMPDGKPYFEPEVAAFIGHAANSLAAHETESATLQGKLSALVILLRARCSDKEWDAMPETLAEVLPAEIATLRKERDEAEKAIAKALRFTPSEEEPEEGAPWMVEAEPEPMGPFSLVEAITAMMKMYDGEFSKADKRTEDAETHVAELERQCDLEVKMRDEFWMKLQAAEAQLSTLREALKEEIDPFPTGLCQLGVLKHCRCQGCIRKRSHSALAPTPEVAPKFSQKWCEDAFVILAGLRGSVVWELAPEIIKEITRLVDELLATQPTEGK